MLQHDSVAVKWRCNYFLSPLHIIHHGHGQNRRGTLPGLKTRDSQIEFIRLNGVRIAACAWNGHRENGRGWSAS